MARLRHCDVTGQQVVESWNVRRTLDRRVPAQRENAAAGSADVSQQQLDNRCSANALDTRRMLRPADGVAERGSPVGARVATQFFCDFQEQPLLDSANLFDGFWRVSCKVTAENLKYALRVLQRVIDFLAHDIAATLFRLRVACKHLALAGSRGNLHAVVLPGRAVVAPLLGIPAAEQSIKLVGIFKVLRD